MKRWILGISLSVGLLTACGGGDGSGLDVAAGASTDTSTTITTTQSTTTTTEATTTSAAPETTTTTEATTTTESPGIPTRPVEPGQDEDVDAIVEAYLMVFDSTSTFAEKSVFITDASGLEETVDAYQVAGESVGGIALSADEVGIEGDAARVIYSFLFAGNPAYTDLEGEAVFTDLGWQVSREFFCDVMASARVGCPAE